MQKIPKAELNEIAQSIYDKKGFNILCLDLRNFTTLADYVLIAEGNNDRHLKAIAKEIQDRLHQMNDYPIFIEGMQSCDWIVLDYSEIIVHLLLPDFREKYELEQLWKQAEVIDLNIILDKPLSKGRSNDYD